MRRLVAIFAALALLGALGAAPASAEFALNGLDVVFENSEGSTESQAGSHPYGMTTSLGIDTVEDPVLEVQVPEEDFKDLRIEFPPGLVADRNAVPQCTSVEFIGIEGESQCPAASTVGFIEAAVGGPDELHSSRVYNLTPPPGVVAKLGFVLLKVPITVEVGLNQHPPYNGFARQRNIPQAIPFYSADLTVWGTPGDSSHDAQRGGPGSADRPFLTLPRSCTGPLQTTFASSSWEGGFFEQTIASHGDLGEPRGMSGCGVLGFGPKLKAQPTADRAAAPTGMQVDVSIEDPQLQSPTGKAASDIKKAVIAFPEGVTLNPSQAEGLGVCSEAQLAGETVDSAPGQGCPQSSKVGRVEAESPLAAGEVLRGALYVAEPYENRFGSLIAVYLTVKSPELGISIALAGEVEPDPETGQIIATFGGPGTDPLPQLPISSFRVRLREGARSPLITPSTCGPYTTRATFTPWADPDASLERSSTFTIDSGVGGGPCPTGGAQPFVPGFEAGSINNAAGRHSPFQMRLTRRDGDQDITRFDATLPKGVVAKLAGVARCPDAAIALAKAKTGRQELAAPSCPAASRIGSVQAGAGVGSQLTYVPGSVYLAGPLGSAPLSVVGVVPAVAGPFDVGTVVVRQALILDPVTAEVRVDGALSDPLPHILAGIPLRVRDIQVDVDRPEFTLNPTSCTPMATLADLWGGGADVFSFLDDSPVARSAPFQAAGCAALGFKPRLAVKLKGGVRRGAHPALRAIVTPRPGEANFSRAVVTLPRSAFLEQAHIRTICTRVQFAAGPGHGAGCPKGAQYGYARAWSPLLDAPAQGPVFLRSSDNKLPDLVVALKGPPSAPIDVELSARIDSVKGGIRSVFAAVPDVPVSRFILDMQGGKKGLIVNSRHLCHKPGRNRAKANLRGQNGRFSRTKPRVIAVTCQKRRKKSRNAKRARVSRALIADRAASRR